MKLFAILAIIPAAVTAFSAFPEVNDLSSVSNPVAMGASGVSQNSAVHALDANAITCPAGYPLYCKRANLCCQKNSPGCCKKECCAPGTQFCSRGRCYKRT